MTSIQLTEIERDTLRMVVQGLTYTQMALQAGVGYETIKTRLVRLRSKTGTPNKTALAVWATANLENTQ